MTAYDDMTYEANIKLTKSQKQRRGKNSASLDAQKVKKVDVNEDQQNVHPSYLKWSLFWLKQGK